jgi:hypothetical protein
MMPRDNTLKTSVMLGTMVLALLALTGWSFSRLTESRDAALAAERDLAESRATVARMEALRQRPAAGTTESGQAAFSRRVDEAARTAGFAASEVNNIVPEPPQRVNNSNEMEVPTQVRLQGVTLEQVFTFLHAMSAETDDDGNVRDTGVRLKSIRLSTPRDEDAGDRWTVESTLTYKARSL